MDNKMYILSLISLLFLAIILDVYFINDVNVKALKGLINEDEKDETINEEKILIGLYKNYHNGLNRELIKEYASTWTYHKDISSFETYLTNEPFISNKNQIQLIDKYKALYKNIDKYKIGYCIEFRTNNENVKKIIISPKDTESFYHYLEIYLYDDYHRSGGWYSHTTEEEYNEETLLTSIKLTAGKDIQEIVSNIKLTVFLYDNINNTANIEKLNNYSLIVKNSY